MDELHHKQPYREHIAGLLVSLKYDIIVRVAGHVLISSGIWPFTWENKVTFGSWDVCLLSNTSLLGSALSSVWYTHNVISVTVIQDSKYAVIE